MRIAVYTDSPTLTTWSWKGLAGGDLPLSGTDGSILRLSAALAGQDYKVVLYCTKPPTDRGVVSTLLVGGLPEAVSEARRSEVDVLVFNNRANQDTAAGISMCDRLGVRCVVWDQNGPSPDFMDILLSPAVRRLVCVSASEANGLRDHPVFYKTEVIHNSLSPIHAAEPAIVDRNTRAQTVCFLGALTPSKGFHHLARAWPVVHACCPDARLLVIGSSALYGANRFGTLGIGDPEYETNFIAPYLGHSRAELRELGVTLVGLANPARVREILCGCAIGVVNPNCSGSTETFCVSAIEVQAARAVVVGARADGLRETVLHRRTGILIRNERDLAHAIVSLLRNPRDLVEMGQNGRKWVLAAFRQEVIIPQWCDLLRSVARDEPVCGKIPLLLTGASPKILAKELIRIMRKVPFVGSRLTTLHHLRERLSHPT
jgi:hypothetical protein